METEANISEKLKEIGIELDNAIFFSNTVKFNSLVYQLLSTIIENQNKILELLNKDNLPTLPEQKE